MKTTRHSLAAGFVLLEVMLAVFIFAIGVITLGRSVSNCLAAEQYKAEDTLARRALENRLVEIEAGAVPIAAPRADDLTAPFTGMKLRQTAAPLKRQNERGADLAGLYAVTLQVEWTNSHGAQARSLTSYVSPRER